MNGVFARVARPAEARIGFLDENGAPSERWFGGLWATWVQRQIDHLDGELHFQRLGPVKRRMPPDRYTKPRRRG